MLRALVGCILMLWAGLAQAGEPPREPAYLCPDEQAQADERCPAQVVLVRHGWVVIEAQRPLRVGERFRLLRWGGVRKARTVPARGIPGKGELTDEEDPAGNIDDRAVHLLVVVGEDSDFELALDDDAAIVDETGSEVVVIDEDDAGTDVMTGGAVAAGAAALAGRIAGAFFVSARRRVLNGQY